MHNERCTSGSEGGPEKPIGRKVDKALRSDPTDRAVSGERAAIFDRLVVVVERRIELLRQFAPSEADAEGLGGLDGADAGLAESVDGTEPVGARGENPAGGTERIQQGLGEGLCVGGGMGRRQQELEQLGIVDRVTPGAREPVPEAVAAVPAAGGAGRRGRREQGHVVGGGVGSIERSPAAASPAGGYGRSAVRARETSMRRSVFRGFEVGIALDRRMSRAGRRSGGQPRLRAD